MKEADLMRLIHDALCRDPAVRLFRNNVGNGWVGTEVTSPLEKRAGVVVLSNARRIQFGLGPGTSDLIGYRSTLIIPAMVGMRIARFAAPEVKGTHGRLTEQQKNFVNVVRAMGGIADVVRSVEEAQELFK